MDTILLASLWSANFLQSNTSNRHIKRPTSLRRRQRNHPPKRPQRLRHLMIALHPTSHPPTRPRPRSLSGGFSYQAAGVLVFAPIATDTTIGFAILLRRKRASSGRRMAYHCPHLFDWQQTPHTQNTFALTQALERNISVRLVGKTGKIGRRHVRILRDTCDFVLSVKTPYHYRSEGHRDAGALWIMLAPPFWGCVMIDVELFE